MRITSVLVLQLGPLEDILFNLAEYVKVATKHDVSRGLLEYRCQCKFNDSEERGMGTYTTRCHLDFNPV